MKIKNLRLALIAVFAFVGISAFAQDAKYANVSYSKDGTGSGTKEAPFGVTVTSVQNEFTTLEIPAAFTKTNEMDETTYFVVTGFGANWANAGGTNKNITEKLTSLTINADNMGNLANAFTGLTKLVSVTVANKETWPNEGYVTGRLDDADLEGQITTLDLSGLEGVTATAGDLKGAKWEKLTSVKLPAKLETLGDNFFEGSKITTITLPVTLKKIGQSAFQESALTALNLNDNVALEEIGVTAFYNCKDLAKLQMSGLAKGDKLTTIGGGAFAGTAITAANIPASVTDIGTSQFEGCKKLTQVSALAGLTKIGANTFKDCVALEKVSINENVTEIGKEAFNGCKALATVTVKTDDKGVSALTTIGDNAFEGCEALAAIDLTATTINSVKGGTSGWWFKGCSALAEVKLPATVTSIGAGAFGDCAIENLDLSNTKVNRLLAIFRHTDGTYPTADKPYSSLKSVTLPEACEYFYDYSGLLTPTGVFAYCTNLQEITIPATFDLDPYTEATIFASNPQCSVPAYAFYYCTSLKTVNYKPTVTSANQVFDDEAFLGCTPFVKINTNAFYTYTLWTIPTNATFGSALDKIKTVEDKGGSGKFYAKLCPLSDVVINPADAKVYSIYVDQGIAYFQSLVLRDGKYRIAAGEHVIIKTDEAKEITVSPTYAGGSVTLDEVFSPIVDTPTADVHDNTAGIMYSDGTLVSFNAGTDYLYRLTNNAATGGFGFTFFSGSTMKADQFFFISQKAPNAAGRIETVWLDENGFVEEEATAIKQIKNVTEDGESYNLAGQKVNASYKGVVIKNGKKYIK
jgi:hypothetical protein